MVGNESGTGGGADEVTAGLRAGYEAAAPAWADGPGPLYARLAHVLVAAAPVPLPGAAVLDIEDSVPPEFKAEAMGYLKSEIAELKSAGIGTTEISNGSQSVAVNIPISFGLLYGGLPSGIPSVWAWTWVFSRL